MLDLTPPGWVIAATLHAVWIGLAAALVPPGRWRRAGLVGTVTLAELVRWSVPFGGVPLAALAFILDEDPYADFTLKGALGMTYVVLVATVVGYWLWFRVIQMVPAGIAALSVLPVPLIGLSLSTIFLDERLGWPDLAALICMTIALAIILPLPRFRRR